MSVMLNHQGGHCATQLAATTSQSRKDVKGIKSCESAWPMMILSS